MNAMTALLRRNPENDLSPGVKTTLLFKEASHGVVGAWERLVEQAMTDRWALALATALKNARMEAEAGADFWRSLNRQVDAVRGR